MLPFAADAQAQWSIGASYEVRSEDPTNGFGVRIERSVLNMVPVVDLNFRAHFSYFNETSDLTRDNISISREIEAYDYGVALSAGLGLGFVKPFVGVGIGAETFDFSENGEGFDESNFHWNGFGGLELDLLPTIKPFIEYRLARLEGRDDVSFSNVGRFAVGVNLRF